jgi:hypothetical protein
VAGDSSALIQRLQKAQLEILKPFRSARFEVRNGIVPGLDQNAAVNGRKKIRIPDLRSAVRAMLGDHDVGREIGIKRSQPVAQPRAQTRHREARAAGVQLQGRLAVIAMIRVHRSDQRGLVHLLANERKQIANLRAAMPVRFKVP